MGDRGVIQFTVEQIVGAAGPSGHAGTVKETAGARVDGAAFKLAAQDKCPVFIQSRGIRALLELSHAGDGRFFFAVAEPERTGVGVVVFDPGQERSAAAAESVTGTADFIIADHITGGTAPQVDRGFVFFNDEVVTGAGEQFVPGVHEEAVAVDPHILHHIPAVFRVKGAGGGGFAAADERAVCDLHIEHGAGRHTHAAGVLDIDIFKGAVPRDLEHIDCHAALARIGVRNHGNTHKFGILRDPGTAVLPAFDRLQIFFLLVEEMELQIPAAQSAPLITENLGGGQVADGIPQFGNIGIVAGSPDAERKF